MSYKKSKNIAVIFAGGIGARMGYKKNPKQFMKAADKPILIYTLECFQKHDEVDFIYLSVVSTHIRYTQELVDKYRLSKVVKIVPGGRTAIETIQGTLQSIVDDGNDDDSIVIIHDGVRPVISRQLISSCISLTEIAGNAIACIPATETVCKSNDGVVAEAMLNRNEMFILQAPQCFRLKNIFDINMKSKVQGINDSFVDQATMSKFFNCDVNLVLGLKDNIKITTLPDYEYFLYLVQTKKYKKIIEGMV